MNTWLNSKVDDTKSIYSDNNLPVIHALVPTSYTKLDLKSSEQDLIKLCENNFVGDDFLKGMGKYIEENDGKKVLFPPNTNRYYCNHLYKLLVNFIYGNELLHCSVEESYGRVLGSDFKAKFYKFCFENT